MIDYSNYPEFPYIVLTLWVLCPAAVLWAMFNAKRVAQAWLVIGTFGGLYLSGIGSGLLVLYALPDMCADAGWFHWIVWSCYW